MGKNSDRSALTASARALRACVGARAGSQADVLIALQDAGGDAEQAIKLLARGNADLEREMFLTWQQQQQQQGHQLRSKHKQKHQKGAKAKEVGAQTTSLNDAAAEEAESVSVASSVNEENLFRPKSKLRSSEDVFNRLKHDPRFDPNDFIVGHLDRFDGMKQANFAEWAERTGDVSLELFVPWHRVYYFQRISDGVRVWDRDSRTDMVFGDDVAPVDVSATAAASGLSEEGQQTMQDEYFRRSNPKAETSTRGILDTSERGVEGADAVSASVSRNNTAAPMDGGVTHENVHQKKTVVTSAVCLIPPENMWGPIQALRRQHDRAYPRWPPHINLLYPFLPEDEFDVAREQIDDMLKAFLPFSVVLGEFGSFQQRKGGALWLDPIVDGVDGAEPDALIKLQQALAGLFPMCNDQSLKSEGGFRPHLSVGQAAKQQVVPHLNKFREGWNKIRFQACDVCLIARGRNPGDDLFRIVHRIPFGGHPRDSLPSAGRSVVLNASVPAGLSVPAGQFRSSHPSAARQVLLEERICPLSFDGQAWVPEDVAFRKKIDVPDTLRVLTWNVLFDLHDKDGELYTDQRWPLLFDQLCKVDADVIALQECTGRFLRLLSKIPWVRERYVLSDVTGATVVQYGQALLVKRSLCILTLWVHREGRRGKSTLFGQLQFSNGDELLIPVVHLTSDHGTNAQQKRAQQLTSMVFSRTDLARDVLLLGDVNFTDGPEDVAANWRSHGFMDAWRELRGDDAGITFDPELNPLAKICSNTGLKRRFDRILTKGKHWAPKHIRLIGTEGVLNDAGEMIFISDHYGVLCTLRHQL